MPGNLQTATHVFVRRGGVHPPLTAPYEGPFRVADRNNQNFKVHIPGKGVEVIAISRIKPAHVPTDEDAAEDPQDLDNERPPSPRPPGRPPGVRTRIPEATDRQTRQTSRQQPAQNPPNTTQAEAPRPPVIESDIEALRRQGAIPKRPTNGGPKNVDPSQIQSTSRQSPISNNPTSGASQPPEEQEPEQQNRKQPVRRYFSSGGRFSRRPKVDISALNRALIETLPEDDAAQPSLRRQLASRVLPSGGRVASLYHHPNSTQRKVTFAPSIDKR